MQAGTAGTDIAEAAAKLATAGASVVAVAKAAATTRVLNESNRAGVPGESSLERGGNGCDAAFARMQEQRLAM